MGIYTTIIIENILVTAKNDGWKKKDIMDTISDMWDKIPNL